MVRLKEKLVKQAFESLKEFQFLNGSIKRGNPEKKFEMKTVFQFLNGSIKSSIGIRSRYNYQISIPEWFD